MIQFHRLNGQTIAINPDLIERVEETPDTVVTLVDDKKFLVAESLEQVLQLITDYRAYVIYRSTDLQVVEDTRPTLHVVPNDVVVSAHGIPEGLLSEVDDDGDDIDDIDDAAVLEYIGDTEIS